ncbi:MAG: PP2C family protein-serine/threonine phosphatase [Candidatus Auribacterota bacterium]
MINTQYTHSQMNCQDTLRVLVVSFKPGEEMRKVSFLNNRLSRIDVFKWNPLITETPEGAYDMVIIYSPFPRQSYLSKLRELTTRIEPAVKAVFGVFDNIDPEEAVTLLSGDFYDVRIIPSSPEKFSQCILTWYDLFRKGLLGMLQKKREHYWKKKAVRRRSAIHNEFKLLNQRICGMQEQLQALNLWQQGSRLDRELKIAHNIQLGLLPKKIPCISGFEFDAEYQPAREIGGDFFDFFRISKHKLGFIIGDVATRGIPAALMMTQIRGMWRALMNTSISPRSVVSRLNYLLHQDFKKMWGMYVSVFCSVVDLKEKVITYTNAGHCYPAVYRASDDSFTELKEGGAVLGVSHKTYYREQAFSLMPQDLVVFYTDGITESHTRPDALFGKDTLYAIIRHQAGNAISDIKSSVFAEIDGFLGTSDFHDDKALVLLKYKP